MENVLKMYEQSKHIFMWVLQVCSFTIIYSMWWLSGKSMNKNCEALGSDPLVTFMCSQGDLAMK